MKHTPSVSIVRLGQDPKVLAALASYAKAASLTTATVGVLVLVGWAADLPVLRSLIPGFKATNPVTAAAFVLTGLGLALLGEGQAWVTGRRIGRVCAMIVGVVAVAKLAGLAGGGLEVDQVLFREKLELVVPPNRMSNNTALNFALVSLALLLLDVPWGRVWPSQLASLAAALIGLLALAGYFYGARELYGAMNYVAMAPLSSLVWIAIGTGVLCARPSHGVMAIVSSDTAGGASVRRLLPAAVAMPLAASWLKLLGEQRGWFGPEFGMAMVAVAMIVILAVLVWWNGGVLRTAEMNRRGAEVADVLRLEAARKDALLQLNAMTGAPLQAITDFALEEAVRLTDSTIGYLAFLNDDETVLTMHSWSKTAMSQCAIIDKPIIYPVVTTGLWGEAVRQRRPVITNDYAAPNPLKKGYPEGHVPIRRHMNVPIFDGDRIVAVAGVGNKQEPYNESDIRQLTLLMQGMWQLLERRRAAESLRESEARRRLLLESVVDYAILTLDPQGCVTSWNVGAETIKGYRSDEILGRHFSVFYSPEDIASGRPQLELETAARQGRTEDEGWRVRKDGSRFWANVVIRAMRDEAGQLRGFVKVTRDISERKRARDAELLNARRLGTLMELNAMAAAPLHEITDFTLEAAVALTGSTIGYLAFLNDDETVLTMHSWSKTAMSQCAIIDKPIVYPVVTTGLWGEAVRQRKAVITNDYAAPNPLKKGYPEGHVHVRRHMNAPIFDGDRIVIVAGVGNKESEYDESDVRQLTLLMQGMWQLMERRKAHQRLGHLNSVLRAVRNVNQLIAREKRVDPLLRGACQCLVEARGYQQAWIVLRDASSRPTAWAEANVGPAWPLLVERLREGKPFACLERSLACSGVALIDEARCAETACPLHQRCRGTDAASVRIRHGEETYGTLIVTFPGGFANDPEEQSLLEEVAGDIGFALHGLSLEQRRTAAEEQTRRQAAVLQALNAVFQEALSCETDAMVARRGLAVAEKLTASQFGFVGEINAQGRLDVIAMSDPGWRECRIPESNAVVLLKDMEIRGIWAEAIREGKPVIVNDPESHPRRVGLPAGHPRLSSFLGVPLRSGDNVIGVISLANKPSGYETADLEAVETLAQGLVEALMRKRAEQGLRKAHDELELRVQERTSQLALSNSDLQRAKLDAESASRAKSTFLANMSHEIRTPLNAIIGMTELVLKSELSAKQREFLATVRDSGEALLSIINDILDFSKIEAGKLVLDALSFDLRESLGDTMKSFAIRAHQQGLELACFIHPDVPHMVVGDYNRLRQVVVNLVGNAIKFTARGEVTLEVSTESRRPEDVLLHFLVSDTGVGIPADKQSKIFEMFEQADTSMTRRHGGTGLGLAIAARLVGLMGGRIWVESEVGRGSAFHFTARLGLAPEEPAEPASPEPICLHGMPVLVVDDNATNRRILEEILASWKMKPVVVDSAWEAIRTLQRARSAGEPFRLVLTDAHMPGADGFALADHIRHDSSMGSTVVMMLTSGDRPDDTSRCEEMGIAAYLLKPVKQSELLEAIELALGIAMPAEELRRAAAERTSHIRCLHILLAEDSPVNQKLAVALLEAQGHTITVANNGKEAVAAARSQKFDAVLMDVQMPEMDGLEAAANIRAWERQAGGHVPIVAMTAHALKGDRERCLEAGMDGYIAKPIRPEELFSAIDGVFVGLAGNASPRAAPAAVVDWAEALKTVQGNRKLLKSLAETALEEAPRLLATIREAAAGGDSAKLRFSAHALKGEFRYFGASQACNYAARLEDMANEGNLNEASAILDLLEAEFTQVTAVLRDYVSEH